MIKMSNLADYAVELMCCIALKPDAIHSSVGLSELAYIPLPTTSKILGMMVRSGLLASHRGLNGGFSLSKSAATISISDIIEAVDGPVQLTNCLGEDFSDCDRHTHCGTRSQWHRINEAVKGALGSVLLSHMVSSVPDFIGDGKADDLPLISKAMN